MTRPDMILDPSLWEQFLMTFKCGRVQSENSTIDHFLSLFLSLSLSKGQFQCDPFANAFTHFFHLQTFRCMYFYTLQKRNRSSLTDGKTGGQIDNCTNECHFWNFTIASMEWNLKTRKISVIEIATSYNFLFWIEIIEIT